MFRTCLVSCVSFLVAQELDSLLSKRGESSEHEASRRIKTEFMVRLDGATTPAEGTANGPAPRVLFMGATNRPWDLDDAVLPGSLRLLSLFFLSTLPGTHTCLFASNLRRRLTHKILTPLPDRVARGAFLDGLLDSRGRDAVASSLSKRERATVVANTDLYSMSDLRALVSDNNPHHTSPRLVVRFFSLSFFLSLSLSLLGAEYVSSERATARALSLSLSLSRRQRRRRTAHSASSATTCATRKPATCDPSRSKISNMRSRSSNRPRTPPPYSATKTGRLLSAPAAETIIPDRSLPRGQSDPTRCHSPAAALATGRVVH